MFDERIEVKNWPTPFLEELFENHLRRIHTKIQLLTWEENVYKEIEGIVQSGSYHADGSSRVRRNLNLTFSVFDRENRKVQEYLTADKKIKLFIGLENNTNQYEKYPIIWFNMGIFILTEPSYRHSTESVSITINAQDKMSMLNGTLGGHLATPVSFQQRQGNKTVSLSWRDIFMQSATMFGNENPAKVIVDSVPDYINEYTQVKTIAGLKSDFIHVHAKEGVDGERIITKAWSPDIPETEIKFSQGERLYKLRRFGPPDPKTGVSSNEEGYLKNIGEPVTGIFEDIVEAMSNTHEFFYNREGDLIFQPIKNYINEIFDPTKDEDLGYFAYEFDMDDFIPNYLRLPFTYDFSTKQTIIDYNNNPSFTNIKNDFVAVASTGEILEIAIDHKPTQEEIKQWFIGVGQDFNMDQKEMDFLAKDGIRREPYNARTNSVWFESVEETLGKKAVYISIPLDKIPWQIGWGLKNYYTRNIYGANNYRVLPRWGQECESMIFKRVASIDKKSALPNTGIFNPSLITEGVPWLAGYPIVESADTEKDVEKLDKNNPIFSSEGDPSFWTYFLDLIPTESKLGQYSIEFLGKRTITTVSKLATTLFRTNPKDLIVVTETELAELGGESILETLQQQGESYAVIKDLQNQLFMPKELATMQKENYEPYKSISGNISNYENLYYTASDKKKIVVGGKHSGTFTANKDIQGKMDSSMLLVSAGEYMHPITRQVYYQTDIGEIRAPFVNDNDMTKFAFVAWIYNKEARCPTSGTHRYFTIIKEEKGKWYYAKQSVDKKLANWTEFAIDPTRDAIVGVIEQTIYGGEFSSHSIDTDIELFNIRDAEMTSLFSIDGATDLFSSVRNLIYQHTNTADVVTISTLPVYQLEPNTLIYAEDELSNISGMFMVTGYTLNLGTSGNVAMNITAIKTNPTI